MLYHVIFCVYEDDQEEKQMGIKNSTKAKTKKKQQSNRTNRKNKQNNVTTSRCVTERKLVDEQTMADAVIHTVTPMLKEITVG